MDDLDNRLLALLRVNARTPTARLARELGVSRSTVQSRMRRLEQRKIIAGYTVTSGSDYERNLISAHVQIKVAQKLTANVYVALRNIPEIGALYTISGDYDLIAVVASSSTTELNALLDRIADLPGIERTNSSVILETAFSR